MQYEKVLQSRSVSFGKILSFIFIFIGRNSPAVLDDVMVNSDGAQQKPKPATRPTHQADALTDLIIPESFPKLRGTPSPEVSLFCSQ